jgi:hypothetical protein
MKKLTHFAVLITIMVVAASINVHSQCAEATATCYGKYVVTDGNPGSYYIIVLRVETKCPTTSDWSIVSSSPIYPGSLGTPISYNGTTADPVGIPDKEDLEFYTIRVKALKYSGTYPNGTYITSREGTSYAGMDIQNHELTAYNDISIPF